MPAAGPVPEAGLAAAIVWFDALITNVDRTPRNTNLLRWHGRLWLIDHGAALYFHHAGRTPGHERMRFEQIREHVLLPFAGPVGEADARLAPLVTRGLLEGIVEAIPAEWLGGDERSVYVDYLLGRLAEPREFVEEAERARGRR